MPRDDKVLSSEQVSELLAHPVLVEEKIDGANLGFSVSSDGEIRIQSRGQYLQQPYIGQFRKLTGWLQIYRDKLFDILGEDLILFGEWCAARHSITYDRLPGWFIVFDVYDRKMQKFWNATRRDAISSRIGLPVVARINQGRVTLDSLKKMMLSCSSAYYEGPVEGLIVRRESQRWLEERAKLVRPDFTQAITDHWISKSLHWNSLRLKNAVSSRSCA